MKTKLFVMLFMLFSAQLILAQDNDSSIKTSKALAKQQELKKYHGAYSTKGNGDVIAIVDAGDKLLCKIPGKPSIPLAADGKHKFKSEKEGLTLEFNPEKNEFIMTEKGAARTYTKA